VTSTPRTVNTVCCRHVQALLAAGRDGYDTTRALTDEMKKWAAPRRARIIEMNAWLHQYRYIALPSQTFAGYALLRSNLASGSGADISAAVAYGKRIRLYPFAQAGDPPPTRPADAADVVFDATIPYDVRFFESLDRFVQAEPWLTRDKVMIPAVAWMSSIVTPTPCNGPHT
jgi:hypothetical protein